MVVVAPHKRILKEPGIDTYTGIYENDSVYVHLNAAFQFTHPNFLLKNC